ncbi:MAG: glycosyl transferase family 2 [Myxococcales bacterium]|nr:glycosyl transferase family 2 [Myxococcales bacterium]
MAYLEIIFLVCYFVVLVFLSLYGLHRYVMVYLYRRHRRDTPEPPRRFEPDELPRVTVQLPCFNERYVIGRLIDAVCKFDYPRDRLEVQVLDDSTDDTTEIAAEVVARWREEGVDVKLIHREDRTGYKAGALEEGMQVAQGELIAVFDADFVPSPDFLRETVDFFTDPGIGMVQARWEHINREYSLLTQVQSILLDGHFVVEHTARNRSGRFFNFNGTAGIWRRQTIAEAGGWQHDTLTEDLDLSYRAQLAGWDFVFLKDVVSPAEIPVEMNAFKSQQHRWAKGSIQTARKLLPTILRSELPLMVKMEAFTHLSNNIAYLLMVLLSIMMPIATVIRIERGWTESLLVDFPVFVLATFSVGTFYIVSQREIGRSLWTSLKFLPMVLSLGIGLSVNNCKAVLEALVGYQTGFTRTPKYAITSGEPRRAWVAKKYIRKMDVTPVVELTLGLWFSLAVSVVLLHGRSAFASLPFLLLFQCGFLYVGLLSLFQTSRWLRRALLNTSDG